MPGVSPDARARKFTAAVAEMVAGAESAYAAEHPNSCPGLVEPGVPNDTLNGETE